MPRYRVLIKLKFYLKSLFAAKKLNVIYIMLGIVVVLFLLNSSSLNLKKRAYKIQDVLQNKESIVNKAETVQKDLNKTVDNKKIQKLKEEKVEQNLDSLNKEPKSLPDLEQDYEDGIDKVFIQVGVDHALRTVNYRTEFDSILKSHCNPALNNLSMSCIQKINKLDQFIEKQRNNFKTKFHKCYDCLFDNATYKKVPFYHHTFWQITDMSSEFNKRALKLQISSFLATQNLCCTRLIVWKLKTFGKKLEEYIKQTYWWYIRNERLILKELDLEELCKFNKTVESTILYSSLAQTKMCKNAKGVVFDNADLVAFSDFVRFFVLDIFGGIYTDGDVIYLKDTRILWNRNFIYKWSYTDHYNTAIIGLSKYANPSIISLYNSVSTAQSFQDLKHIFHPFSLTNRAPSLEKANIYTYKSMKLIHSSLFDPAWLCNDAVINRYDNFTICGFRDFNVNLPIKFEEFSAQNSTIFPGAFTYHIHLKNCGDVIRNDSYFNLLERHFKSKLKLVQ